MMIKHGTMRKRDGNMKWRMTKAVHCWNSSRKIQRRDLKGDGARILPTAFPKTFTSVLPRS